MVKRRVRSRSRSRRNRSGVARDRGERAEPGRGRDEGRKGRGEPAGFDRPRTPRPEGFFAQIR